MMCQTSKQHLRLQVSLVRFSFLEFLCYGSFGLEFEVWNYFVAPRT
jgi:hypothetical protein